MKDWRTHCFDLFGDIADGAGANSNAPPPPWFQAGKPPDVDVVTGASPVVFPVDLFPQAVANPLLANAKLQAALTSAIQAAEVTLGLNPGSFPVPFSIVDISSGSLPFPVGGHLENEQDYIASEAKVGVMYAAYVLRDMVRRFATALSITSAKDLFAQLPRMHAAILKAVPAIANAGNITDLHRLPSWASTFSATPSGAGLDIQFTTTYDKALEGMIVPSSNERAADSVHGVGYAYLNGALQAGGFFDATSQKGIWVAGDFMGGTKWPALRLVQTSNDGLSAQASTTQAMASLIAQVAGKSLLDTGSCDEMLARMQHAAQGPDKPWIARAGGLSLSVVSNDKIGQGPLNAAGSPMVDSEISVLTGVVASDRKYVVAWQNLLNAGSIQFSHIATIIVDTITAYEKP